MWSDDGTNQSFLDCRARVNAAGDDVEFTATFRHPNPLPPNGRWFAVLWPKGKKLPGQATLAPAMRKAPRTPVAVTQEAGGTYAAKGTFVLAGAGQYELIVGYTTPGTAGSFGDFGAVVVP